VNYARNGKQRGRDQDRDLANGSGPQAPNMTAEEIRKGAHFGHATRRKERQANRAFRNDGHRWAKGLPGIPAPKCGAAFDPNKLARAIKQIEGSFAAFSDS
jgi:hypothetical protein